MSEKHFPCALGRSGIVDDKREGDGGTPAGVWKLQTCWLRSDRWPTPPQYLPTHLIKASSGWSDDPDDPEYNCPVTLPHIFSYEKLWRLDDQYDVIITLDHNLTPIVPGAGSAVFLHLAKPDYGPTEGCIAISRAHMREILPFLTPETNMIIQT